MPFQGVFREVVQNCALLNAESIHQLLDGCAGIECFTNMNMLGYLLNARFFIRSLRSRFSFFNKMIFRAIDCNQITKNLPVPGEFA